MKQLTSQESTSWKRDSIHKQLPTCQYDVSDCLWFGHSNCCMFFLGEKKPTEQLVQSMKPCIPTKQRRITQACCCRAHRDSLLRQTQDYTPSLQSDLSCSLKLPY